jgi:hypothetical protein
MKALHGMYSLSFISPKLTILAPPVHCHHIANAPKRLELLLKLIAEFMN